MQKQMLYNVEMDNKYKDIIDIDYEKIKSSWGSNISIEDRAAQFAPFAALTGHEEAIEEVGNTHKADEAIREKFFSEP